MTVVITTINVPDLLEGYFSNLEQHGHLGLVDVIIIGDRKTPHDALRDMARSLTGRGLKVEYVDLDAQAKYMRRFPELDQLLPFNSDIRRNIGYLMAYEGGAEIVVALDDDNFVSEDDWYMGHTIVGKRAKLRTVSSDSSWYNVCSMMATDPPDRVIYARGHPYAKRHIGEKLDYSETEGRVVLNGGLWLREPDVDSLTRLTEPVKCTAVLDERLMLAPGTWAPINSQNTAFHRDVMPVFFFVPISAHIGGIVVERYGDIWAGLLARKAIDHMDERVTYGIPACDHRRNPHVLLKDLELEFWSVLLTEQLWEKLYTAELKATTYADAYLEMADLLEAAEWKKVPMPEEVKAYFGRLAASMRTWIETLRRV